MNSRKPAPRPWDVRIADVLSFGRFISWRDVSMFREDLDRLLGQLEVYAKESPKKAASVFEDLIAGCLAKGQEIDDSGDDLGMYLDQVFQAWTRCCELAGVAGRDYVRKLAHWKRVDDIGYCSRLEETVIPVLGKEFRESLKQSLEERRGAGDSHAAAILKKLFASTKNTTALISICEKHGAASEDCLGLAVVFQKRGQLDRALEWAEKGLKLDSESGWKTHDLKKVRRQILKESGRRPEAIADAWADFEKSPSIFLYRDLTECASRKELAALRQKALVVFDQADLSQAAVAFCDLDELEHLAARISAASDMEIREIFYGDAIPIAKTLTRRYPREAARIYITQAEVILTKKRSRAYLHAHDYLSEAKDLLERAGDPAAWANLVARIRQEHGLKSSFMPGFERIVAGKGAPREPTFRERIASKLDRSAP